MFDSIKQNLREIQRQLPHLPRALSLAWATARLWTLAWLVILVIQGLLPATYVYLTRSVVDSLVPLIGAGFDAQQKLQSFLWWTLLYGAVMLMGMLLDSFYKFVQAHQNVLVNDHVNTLIQAKSISLDLEFFETQQYYDLIERAAEATNKPLALLKTVGRLVQNGLALLTIGGLLLSYGVLVPLVLLISTMPAIYLNGRYTRDHYAWWVETTIKRRRMKYYQSLMTREKAAAELRLFDLGEYFYQRWIKLRDDLREEQFQWVRQRLWIDVIMAFMTITGIALAGSWLVWQTIEGQTTLGDLALFAQAFNQGRSTLKGFSGIFGEIHRELLHLDHLFQFLNLEPTIIRSGKEALPMQLEQNITFHNITFAYPQSSRTVLENFSVTFPAGKLIAIVGRNGAGKSTLIKLLCRFYDPLRGKITLDGVDLREINLTELRRQITIIFQNSVRYDSTAAQNIAVGALSSNPSLTEIQAAAQATGADGFIRTLAEGYDTKLGKRFGGEQLSGGQWQRLALARAFVRDSSIIILDEPTSAMDPWRRNKWLLDLRRSLHGRTTFLITHRFTTAMQADVIYVLDEGKVIESGTHQQLLAGNGHYAQSWQVQKQAEYLASQSIFADREKGL